MNRVLRYSLWVLETRAKVQAAFIVVELQADESLFVNGGVSLRRPPHRARICLLHKEGA